MPGLYKDEGIVLKTIKLGEADRIITLFTRRNGKVRAVAKGIRKTKSRFGARLEPFTRVELMIYRGRNLDTITGADILEPFKGVHDDYSSLTAAAALAELVDKITPDQEQAVSVYTLLLAGLQSLAVEGTTTVVPAFCLKLLSLSGYHPQLQACAGCNRMGGLGGFSPAMGGAVCRPCSFESEDVVRMPEDRIAFLWRLLVSDFGQQTDSKTTSELVGVLRSYAEYHLERPLKSMDLLARGRRVEDGLHKQRPTGVMSSEQHQ